MPLLFSTFSPPARRFSGAAGLRALWLLLFLGVYSVPAAADGRFEVVNASARPAGSAWLVDARIDLELSSEALDALDSGVPLSIEFQYEVTQRRRFWADRVVVNRQQNFELQYLSLSQRYVVRNLDTLAVNSYATLFSALRYLGQVRDFRVTDEPLDGSAAEHTFGLRAVLDWEKLPGPLAMLNFWRGDFSLESDWYRWTPS